MVSTFIVMYFLTLLLLNCAPSISWCGTKQTPNFNNEIMREHLDMALSIYITLNAIPVPQVITRLGLAAPATLSSEVSLLLFMQLDICVFVLIFLLFSFLFFPFFTLIVISFSFQIPYSIHKSFTIFVRRSL